MRALIAIAMVLLAGAAPARADRAMDDVDRTIRAQVGPLRKCYLREVDRDASVKKGGKVVVRFTIRKDGSTARVRIDSEKSTLRRDRLSRCLVGVFQSMQFGADSTEATVSYPLFFSSP